MKAVTPFVTLIAAPRIEWTEVGGYLEQLGAGDWETDAVGDGDALPEIAGRTCYRSWKPGLNVNITKIREGNRAYLANVIDSGHGSVFEHVQATFMLHHVSRVLTHELVRHRVGCAISQESMRYVAITDIPFWMPTCFTEDPDLERRQEFQRDQAAVLLTLELFQAKWRMRYGLDDDGVSFARKKEVTSGLRRWAPQGIATDLLWSANLRTLRHVIELRTALAAEEEIRLVFDAVASICKTEFPAAFQDFTRSDDGVWTPRRSKL